SGNVTIASGANLDFGTGAGQTNIVANNISGDGQIIQSTAGTDTRITGNVTSTGGLTIESGTVRIGDGGTTGSYTGNTTVNATAALAFARSNAYTHGGTISGAGGVSKVNAGVVTLTGNNSYSGNTSLFDGALVADHANALGTGTISFSSGGGNNGTIRYTAASAGTDWASRIQSSSGAIRLDTTGNNVNLAGIIDDSNVGGLVKSGTGTLTLGGANNYGGATTVGAGTLLINGDQSGATGILAVAANATLGGSGTIGGATTISGILAPGNSIGTLTTVGDVTWNASVGNNWVFELGAAGLSLATPGTSDFLSVGGDFLRGTGSAWTFDFAGGGDLGWYKLVEWSGTSDFELLNFSGVNLGGGFDSDFAIQDDALYVNVVPEPSTYALLALAAAGLGAHVVRRRRSR
ncbi:MAG: autotransporter-associated beta strand repeat-containing protein, partial [Chthoniobacterales bacterium]